MPYVEHITIQVLIEPPSLLNDKNDRYGKTLLTIIYSK
jgi:hypothetical protein